MEALRSRSTLASLLRAPKNLATPGRRPGVTGTGGAEAERLLLATSVSTRREGRRREAGNRLSLEEGVESGQSSSPEATKKDGEGMWTSFLTVWSAWGRLYAECYNGQR